jgi:HAD superfamily phosphatase (TIGR01681 family)
VESVRLGCGDESAAKRLLFDCARRLISRYRVWLLTASGRVEGLCLRSIFALMWAPTTTPSLPASVNPKRTLVVFDFDCTLSVVHMYQILRREEGQGRLASDKSAFYTTVFGGQQRIVALSTMLSALQNSGCKIRILSFGFESEIEDALTDLQLRHYFEHVYGSESFGRFGVRSNVKPKQQFLSALLSSERDSFDSYLFIDDDRTNFPSNSVKKFDAFKLVGSNSQAAHHLVLFVYPVGTKKDGEGLKIDDMEELTKFVSSNVQEVIVAAPTNNQQVTVSSNTSCACILE